MGSARVKIELAAARNAKGLAQVVAIISEVSEDVFKECIVWNLEPSSLLEVV